MTFDGRVIQNARRAVSRALDVIECGTAQIEIRQKTGTFKSIEEILETSRSGPCLLSVLRFQTRWSVSRSRGKSQQI
jgi:hypothetical protein